jgi:hypothetical protein
MSDRLHSVRSELRPVEGEPLVSLIGLEGFAARMQLRAILLDQLTATLIVARELSELVERVEAMPL